MPGPQSVRRAPALWVVALVSGAAGSVSVRPAAAEDITPQTLAAVKSATVFVRVELGRQGGSGSGFVVRTAGKSAWVVTNAHVVAPAETPAGVIPKLSVVFRSGQGREKELVVPAELTALDADHDLAVLKVAVDDVKDLPLPLTIPAKPQLVETMGVYILGYPFGNALNTGSGHPAVTVNKGSISSIRNDDAGNPVRVQIDGSINPGNSGGPVVDAKGRLAGVAVATIKGTGIGFAIPPHEVNHLLNGRIVRSRINRARLNKSVGDLEVEADFLDPLGKVRGVSFHWIRPEEIKDKDKTVPKDGVWRPLSGSRPVSLVVKGQTAGGVAKVPGADKGGTLIFQYSYINGEGRTIVTSPREVPLSQFAETAKPETKNATPKKSG